MSEIQNHCFKDFIGLSRTECDCFGTPPTDFNISLSDLYIDELEGQQLRMKDALHDCKDGSLWMFLYNARQQSITSVKQELIQGIAASNKLRRTPFQGILGEHEMQSGSQLLSELLVGRRWIMNPIRGGKMIVKGIWVNIDQTMDFNIALYNQLSDTPLEVINLLTQANSWKYNELSTPLSLEMYSDEVRFLNYYWLLAPIGFNVFRNQIHCGCSGKTPSYDCNYPTFPENMDNIWNAYLMDLGVRGNVLADRANWRKDLSEAYGIRFNVQMYCSVEQTICSALMNFDSSEIPSMISQMLQFKSGYYVNSYLLALPEPTEFTTVNREQLEKDRTFYFREFNRVLTETIDAFSSERNIKLFSDCYTCREDVPGFRKTGIMA